MQLTKHHGLGNDFIVVVDPDATHPVDAALARALCDRHTGIGADGVMRATPPGAGSDAHARMELLNADGSRAEMSGNGIRCLAQALILDGWVGDASEIAVDTDAGRRTVTVHGALDGVTHDLSVAMGRPRDEGPAPEWAGGDVARARLVDIGNPHLVLDLSAAGPAVAAEVDLVALGASANDKIAGGANVHLVTATLAPAAGAAGTDGGGGADIPGIAVRTYERGVGPTLACGTGACASAVAARAWGLVGATVPIDMPGGRAQVELGPHPGDEVVLRGPATFVATVRPGVSPWH